MDYFSKETEQEEVSKEIKKAEVTPKDHGKDRLPETKIKTDNGNDGSYKRSGSPRS